MANELDEQNDGARDSNSISNLHRGCVYVTRCKIIEEDGKSKMKRYKLIINKAALTALHREWNGENRFRGYISCVCAGKSRKNSALFFSLSRRESSSFREVTKSFYRESAPLGDPVGRGGRDVRRSNLIRASWRR